MSNYLQKGKTHESSHDGLTLKFGQLLGGLFWHYKNSHGETLSVICHTGSYGSALGEFEIIPSWRNPNGRGKDKDTVHGYLTFGQVQRWINELRRRGGVRR